MTGTRYSHRHAMHLLVTKWPFRPTWKPGGWFRACPKGQKDRARMPSLYRSALPGSLEAETRPDGMYLLLSRARPGNNSDDTSRDDDTSGDDACNLLTADVLAMEHCGSIQNLHDKRSRYQAAVGSVVLRLPKAWLLEKSESRKTKGRPSAAGLRETWEAIDTGVFLAPPDGDRWAVVARLRLFLFVPDDDLAAFNHKVAREAHEYLLPHSALDGPYDPRLVRLLDHAFNNRIMHYYPGYYGYAGYYAGTQMSDTSTRRRSARGARRSSG